MITAYYKYADAHTQLTKVDSNEERFALAEIIIENYPENRLIWKELNYYKNTGNVLGEHPIWNEYKLEEKWKAANAMDMVKRLKNLENYLHRENKKLTKKLSKEEAKKVQKRIKDFELEKSIIEKVLNAA